MAKDVVCGMTVNPGSNQVEYLGEVYSFCSRQCRERFEMNPHLYIGLPGQMAPKAEGRSIIKQRRLHWAHPLSPAQVEILGEALLGMMGIQAISPDGDRLTIQYDLLEVTTEQIENKLVEIGIVLGEGWAERLRRAFVHYEEECEIGNLEVQDSRFIHRHIQ